MYAYLDESGHSGSNLFDSSQRHFYACAVMSSMDLDSRYSVKFNEYAQQHGQPHLHAAEMGVGRLLDLLPRLQKDIKRDTIRFFIGHIDKRWFALCKFFDLIFDSEDNLAVPKHVYLVKQLRYILLLKLDYILTEDILKEFWEGIFSDSHEDADRKVRESLKKIPPLIKNLPDERSRQIVGDAIKWANENIDRECFHFSKKKDRCTHLPNIAMFTPMMISIERQAQYWGTKVKSIIHDRQSQVLPTLRQIHATLSSPEQNAKFQLLGGEEVSLRAATGSNFKEGKSTDSAGIQLADLVLWLFKRKVENNLSDEIVDAFLSRAIRQADYFAISRDSAIAQLESSPVDILCNDLSARDREKGIELLRQFEEQRQHRLAEFEKRKHITPGS